MVVNSVADYRQAMRQQMPAGILWTEDPDSDLMRLLEALGAEFRLVDEAAEHALEEIHFSETTELLAEWEAAAGLPDPCTGQLPTLAERRAALVARLTNPGGQSPGYFLELAATLGYTVDTEIEEFDPFEAGLSEAGDHLTDEEWAFVWVFHGPYSSGTEFIAGDAEAGDLLGSFGNDALECTLERVKPAHTLLHFAYDKGLAIMEPVRATATLPAITIIAT